MKLFLHEPKVVARGPVCEEAAWGYFQFPRVHKLPDGRLAVWIHDEDDQPHTLGLGAKLFIIAGPVIVYGISTSALYGLILYLLKLY